MRSYVFWYGELFYVNIGLHHESLNKVSEPSHTSSLIHSSCPHDVWVLQGSHRNQPLSNLLCDCRLYKKGDNTVITEAGTLGVFNSCLSDSLICWTGLDVYFRRAGAGADSRMMQSTFSLLFGSWAQRCTPCVKLRDRCLKQWLAVSGITMAMWEYMSSHGYGL